MAFDDALVQALQQMTADDHLVTIEEITTDIVADPEAAFARCWGP